MKITLESTSKIVELNGVPARVWEGKSESGIPCHAFITRIAVPNPSYEIIAGKNGWPDTIKCLLCGAMTNNLNDVTWKYCAACDVSHDQVHQQFDAELEEQRAPSAAVAEYPLRMVL